MPIENIYSIDFFYDLLYIMFLVGLVVFVSLYFVDAGYGKMRTEKWGPAINNKVGWLLMECPVFFVMLYLYFKSFPLYDGVTKHQTNPRAAAERIIPKLDMSSIDKVEIAGPGFINFFMKSGSLQSIVKKIIDEGENYGRGEKKNKRINVEFVSANPTGDLHIGHARGAAIGDSISRILTFDGYDVTREYYVNDAGNQIYNLALSLQARYFEQLGLPFTLPEDGYHGPDIIEIAKKLS